MLFTKGGTLRGKIVNLYKWTYKEDLHTGLKLKDQSNLTWY